MFEGLPAGEYQLSEGRAPKGYVILQKYTYFTLTNNFDTGELDITLLTREYAYLGNNMLCIINGWRDRDGSGGIDKLDENSPFPKPKIELTEEIPGTPINLPNAGGFPASYIGFVGLLSILVGGALLLKGKKDISKMDEPEQK